ncbi:HD domain-containing protein [Archaeoglobus neptunius]|uniref:HD domain-containing protein n=1 Tax=Archaeoglobus neptunius TaxID=2798580 RepID=UPI0019295644|nr:HD domain-containing protein [Archaeoglobus neptunius]
MEKSIQDSIHGVIKLEDWMIEIIDTPQFQRLRRIKQLGFANLVYPGANHTRFEHSLGVMHITRLLKEKLDLDDVVVVAALLHDVGHAPFSHSSERLMKKYAGIEHERISAAVRNELKDTLNDLGFTVGEIEAIVTGKRKSIVNGDIDADRMDYLVRDSHYTGVAYGVFDLYRLIDKIKLGNGLVVEYGGIKAAESLLISRYMMYPTVYFHHVCRIARKMYEKAMERIIEGGFDAKKLMDMDDFDAMQLLKEKDREFYHMLVNRRLFKRAVYVSKNAVDFREVMRVNERRAEEEIAEDAGVDERYVIVDIPPVEEMKESEVLVETESGLKSLDEVSPLVNALKTASVENWRLGVYTRKEYIDSVGKAAMDYFGIKRVVQKSLDEIFP